ncbi:MAG: DNA internalization-related competence protein ComEC/Rec2 [Bacilli bacterium]
MIKLKIILLCSFLICICYCNYIVSNYIINTNYSIKSTKLTGIITNYKIDGNQLTMEIKSKETVIAFYYFNEKNEVEDFINNYEIGSTINIQGEFSEPSSNSNFNLFNYKNYLYSKKIYWIVKVKTFSIVKAKLRSIYKLKRLIINRIELQENKYYLNLFILGENNLDSEIYKNYQKIGVSHLFAISGMHISIICLILTKFLDLIFKNKYIKFIILEIFLIIFLFLTNSPPSVVRAIFFLSSLKFLKLINVDLDTIYVLIIILIILLFLNPYYIFNLGFKFSFIISLTLIYCRKLFEKFTNYFIKVFIISLISFLVSIPIQINTFFEINLLSPLINILFVPFISIFVFPLTIITFFIPFFTPLLNFFIIILEMSSKYLNNIDFFTIILCHINIYFLIFYYVIIFIIIHLILNDKIFGIIILIPILVIHNNILLFNKYSFLTMIDVSQGDSIILSLQQNKGNILLDTGGTIDYSIGTWKEKQNKFSLGKNTIIPYLKSVGIKTINYLILTHGDYDHIGEAITLVNKFNIKNIIFNNDSYNNLELELIEILDKKNINYYKNVNELNINNYILYFLNPGGYNNENDNSNIIYFKNNEIKMLFMGDASVEVEKIILNKYKIRNIDILKVGHHGSNTSSNNQFINIINPKISLISVGKNNKYGHPKNEVLRLLSKSKVYRTDINGSIQIKFKNNKIKVTTCN